ncbi:helix-turn-helix transcriptional regulator [Rhizomonospora bruguierae]|uniref:helix-turn-helix transcriptional regulator n=1 Tax=Rhizomonospora bruguierae TaxID=1581705 RepID=UPI001BCBE666|nr:response regulator transcription factor [Micromonospora sp. NBRC 107566]
MEQVRVALWATDSLSQAGLANYLQSRPEIALLRPADRAQAQVLVISVERLSADVVTMLRRSAVDIGAPVVLVTSEIDESKLLTTIGCQVVAVLPRPTVTAEQLVRSVLTAAAGGGVMPPNLIGELLKQIERLQRTVLNPNGRDASGLTTREIDVLRLLADGLGTHEIADELCYSERTVKNVIYGITHRLKLRNRSHAVAYALRAGMI